MNVPASRNLTAGVFMRLVSEFHVLHEYVYFLIAVKISCASEIPICGYKS